MRNASALKAAAASTLSLHTSMAAVQRPGNENDWFDSARRQPFNSSRDTRNYALPYCREI